jgi:triacylglycerol lipase
MVTAADNPPKFAYFGKDSALYAERSSLNGLIEHCHIPLLVGVNEYDPADFQSQFLMLLNRLFERDKHLPSVIYHDQHNHLSSIFLLGSSADTVGGPLGEFVAGVLNN